MSYANLSRVCSGLSIESQEGQCIDFDIESLIIDTFPIKKYLFDLFFYLNNLVTFPFFLGLLLNNICCPITGSLHGVG